MGCSISGGRKTTRLTTITATATVTATTTVIVAMIVLLAATRSTAAYCHPHRIGNGGRSSYARMRSSTGRYAVLDNTHNTSNNNNDTRGGTRSSSSSNNNSSSSSSSHRRSTFPRHSVVSCSSRLGREPSQNTVHAPMVYHEQYSFADWPENHTFPMNKFKEIANAVVTTPILLTTPATRTRTTTPSSTTTIETAIHEVVESEPTQHREQPNKKLRPLVRSPQDFYRPLDVEHIPYEDWFFPIMNEDYVTRFLEGMLTYRECRNIGFSEEQTRRPELIDRTVLEVAGTVLTCQLALRYGLASNLAGGTHHASPTQGAGFTILNDLAVASRVLLHDTTNTIQRVLVIDCDVHQGDGTAQFIIPGLSTLSIHCQSNYPFRKAQSTYDIGLHDGCSDAEYLEIFQTAVQTAITEVAPDFIIYDAGVDVYKEDKLGKLQLTEHGIRSRDRWILNRCVASKIPIAAVVGGGYDPTSIRALARRHAIIHEECAYIWRKYSMWTNGGEKKNE